MSVPKIPEIGQDWIDHLMNGYLTVDHMNRLIIFASENNFELDSNNIDLLEMNNPKYLHDILWEESTRMINIINKLNNINNLLLENMITWLFSYEQIQFKPNNKENMILFSKNMTDMKQRFEQISEEFPIKESFHFQNFSANLIQLLGQIHANEFSNQSILIDQLHLWKEFNSQSKEEHLTLTILEEKERSYEEMIYLYGNYEITKDLVEQALKDLREARQRHDHARIFLGQIVDRNQTLRVQRIERKQNEQLFNFDSNDRIPIINSKSLVVNKFNRQIKSTQQLCETFDISMKFMIERLNSNQIYFRLKTNQDRLDHLRQLNIQKNNQSQCIFSSFKPETPFIHSEEN